MTINGNLELTLKTKLFETAYVRAILDKLRTFLELEKTATVTITEEKRLTYSIFTVKASINKA